MFKIFDPTNTIWLTFMEKKTKKIGNWKCPLTA